MAEEDWLYENRPMIAIQSRQREIRFKDLNPSFTLDSYGVIIEEDLAIKAQIRNILSIIKGSENFEPSKGSLLPLRIYDPITPLTGYILESDTIIAINRWLGDRITVLPTLSIIPLEESIDDGYVINIPYIIKQSNVYIEYSFQALR